MLPKNCWKWYEPRFGFPIFRGIDAHVSFSVRSDFRPLSVGKLHIGARAAFRRGMKEAVTFLRQRIEILLFCRSKEISFRLIFLSRKGLYLGELKYPRAVPPGGSIDLNISSERVKLGLPDDDMMAMLVMSNGRQDAFRSSPGSYSMTYVGPELYATYRTGGFARALNERGRHRHVGFRGINPKVVENITFSTSILLINHSSDPKYSDVARPLCILRRADGKYLEAEFGEIQPFGGLERSMVDLFGEDVLNFLEETGGRGTTVITCPGISLASLHIMRRKDGRGMSIEHSRPSHTYLLHGVQL